MTSDGNFIVSSTLRADNTNNYFKVFETSNQTLNIVEQEFYNLNFYFENNDLVIKHKNIKINDIKIYNILGQKISLNIDNSSLLKIRFSKTLKTGVYLIKLNTDKGILSKKILFNISN